MTEPEPLPDTHAGCEAEMSDLRADIAAIKIQIADADQIRQAEGIRPDRLWLRAAKTALLHKQRRYDAVRAHQAVLRGGINARLEMFRAIIDIVRADYDDNDWEEIIEEAKERLRKAAPNGAAERVPL
jgi:hypothetical protein